MAITTIRMSIPPEHPITDKSVLHYAATFVKKVSETDPKNMVRFSALSCDKVTASLLDSLVLCLLKKTGRAEHYMSDFYSRPDGTCICILYWHEHKEFISELIKSHRHGKRPSKKSQI